MSEEYSAPGTRGKGNWQLIRDMSVVQLWLPVGEDTTDELRELKALRSYTSTGLEENKQNPDRTTAYVLTSSLYHLIRRGSERVYRPEVSTAGGHALRREVDRFLNRYAERPYPLLKQIRDQLEGALQYRRDQMEAHRRAAEEAARPTIREKWG